MHRLPVKTFFAEKKSDAFASLNSHFGLVLLLVVVHLMIFYIPTGYVHVSMGSLSIASNFLDNGFAVDTKTHVR